MAGTKIITVTLNPSLDRTLTVHYLALGYHNRTAETTRLDAAGKGVNISRALHKLNRETQALILLGDDATGRAYQALIEENGFPVNIARRTGATRSNIVLLDTGNKHETHLIEETDSVTRQELEAVAARLRAMIAPEDIVVFAGSLPGDAPADTYAWLTEIAHEAGAQVAVVTFGETLSAALKANPDLVVLDQQELEALFNHPVRAQDDVIYCMEKLREGGVGKVMALVDEGDSDAAILISKEGRWQVSFPDVEATGTSIGAIDALVAGFLARRVNERPLDEALELGAAAATYAVTQVGSEFGSLNEMQEYIDDADVTPLDE
jgi:1-phosphofructokinase